MVKDRSRNTKRTVGSHQDMMGALNRASKREPFNTERLFAGPEFGRLTPETHVNVVSNNYHKKFGPQDSERGKKYDNNSFPKNDYDKHAMDETRYKDTMPK